MINNIIELLKKYREVISYLIFGFLTTLVNFVTYFIAHNLLGIDEIISNIIAWFVAVVFAFITNKTIVFESKKKTFKALAYEVSSFFIFRIVTRNC